MTQRESEPMNPEEPGEHVPNLEIHLPELIAEVTDRDPEAFDYPVGEYPVPDLDEQDEEIV